MITKKCIACLVEKPISEFNKYPPSQSSAYQPRCILCHNLRRKKLYEKNRERILSVTRANNKRRLDNMSEKELLELKKKKFEYHRQYRSIHKKPKTSLTKRREYHFREKYKMEITEYDKLSGSQGGLCAICKRPPNGRWKRLNTDHCHKTGKIRGLLCVGCNRAIGNLDDSPSKARKLAKYLRKTRI